MTYEELRQYIVKCKKNKKALPRACIAKDVYYMATIRVNKGTTGKLSIWPWGIYFIADGSKEEVLLHENVIFDYLHCPSLGIIHS